MTSYAEPLDSVLEAVGRTPMVRVQGSPDEVPVYAKVESFNPGASVKDRTAKYMLERMLERGEVTEDGTVVEATAGNTGIGLALAAPELGLDAILVVPEGFSVEKQQLMDALGAEVVNTPGDDGMVGAIDRGHEIVEELDDAVFTEQFANPLNTEAHYETTGPEIYEALDGEVGAVVMGCGTGGTLMGVARYALEQDPDTFVAAVEPEGSLYRELLDKPATEGDFKTEGIGTTDTSNKELFEPELVDDVVAVPDERAHAEVQRLAAEEGHLVASSAGAASVGAQQVAERIRDGEIDAPHDTVVTLFPDSSERYLSDGIHGSFEEWDG